MNEATPKNGSPRLPKKIAIRELLLAAAMSAPFAGGMVYFGEAKTAPAVESYRLDQLEERVRVIDEEVKQSLSDLTVEMKALRLSFAESVGDRWTRADHDRWVREVFEVRLKELEAQR